MELKSFRTFSAEASHQYLQRSKLPVSTEVVALFRNGVCEKPTQRNRKTKMKNQMCVSISKRNIGLPERIDDYSKILCLSKSDTIAHIFREWEKSYQRRQVFTK